MVHFYGKHYTGNREMSKRKKESPATATVKLAASDNAPTPAAPTVPGALEAKEPVQTTSRPDPTRFGDWEKDGRCIDF